MRKLKPVRARVRLKPGRKPGPKKNPARESKPLTKSDLDIDRLIEASQRNLLELRLGLELERAVKAGKARGLLAWLEAGQASGGCAFDCPALIKALEQGMAGVRTEARYSSAGSTVCSAPSCARPRIRNSNGGMGKTCGRGECVKECRRAGASRWNAENLSEPVAVPAPPCPNECGRPRFRNPKNRGLWETCGERECQIARQQTGREAALLQVKPTGLPWCEPCGSYHAAPVDDTHHQLLGCKAVPPGGPATDGVDRSIGGFHGANTGVTKTASLPGSPSPADDSVDQLELSVRAANALDRGGVKTLGALCALSADELHGKRFGLAQRHVDEIADELGKLGLSLVSSLVTKSTKEAPQCKVCPKPCRRGNNGVWQTTCGADACVRAAKGQGGSAQRGVDEHSLRTAGSKPPEVPAATTRPGDPFAEGVARREALANAGAAKVALLAGAKVKCSGPGCGMEARPGLKTCSQKCANAKVRATGQRNYGGRPRQGGRLVADPDQTSPKVAEELDDEPRELDLDPDAIPEIDDGDDEDARAFVEEEAPSRHKRPRGPAKIRPGLREVLDRRRAAATAAIQARREKPDLVARLEESRAAYGDDEPPAESSE